MTALVQLPVTALLRAGMVHAAGTCRCTSGNNLRQHRLQEPENRAWRSIVSTPALRGGWRIGWRLPGGAGRPSARAAHLDPPAAPGTAPLSRSSARTHRSLSSCAACTPQRQHIENRFSPQYPWHSLERCPKEGEQNCLPLHATSCNQHYPSHNRSKVRGKHREDLCAIHALLFVQFLAVLQLHQQILQLPLAVVAALAAIT